MPKLSTNRKKQQQFMSRKTYYRLFQIFFFLFVINTLPVEAQENSIYNEILKESLKIDLKEFTLSLERDSNFNIENFDKENFQNIYRNFKIENLENAARLMPKDKMPQLSCNIKLFPYTSSNKEPIDTEKFNGNGRFTGEFTTKENIMMSKGAYFMVGIVALFELLEKTGVLSDKKHESKKEKALREIKMVYQIED